MFPARVFAVAPLALVILALSGCSSWGCTDTIAKRGKAGVRVQVVDTDGQPLGVTAAIVDWSLEPHPHVPSEGDRAHFHFHIAETGGPFRACYSGYCRRFRLLPL